MQEAVVEALQTRETVRQLVEVMRSCAPALVEVVLDERDELMARELWEGRYVAAAVDNDAEDGGADGAIRAG